ncbi:MAG: glycosyltransferase [Deltaproteobacteria bacterium]|nr:glycosyltransferase [Deltaproteobacteria bacterium]
MGEHTTILYLITATNAGGTEKALWELVRRLDTSRFCAHVCSLKKPGIFGPRLASAAAGFHTLALSEAGGLKAALNFLPACVRLGGLVRRVRPDIIHSFLFRANICGRLAGRLLGVPINISSLRVTEAGILPHFVDRMTAGMVDRYTAVSEAVRQEAMRRAGIAPEKIIMIPNGIDCSETSSPSGDPGIFKIALFGRFHRQKGHAVLLHALKLLDGQGLPVQACLFGEGPDEAALKKMAFDLGIADRVCFMGVVDNPVEAMAGMDVIVLPSLWEGMPNAVLEAMAAGRPVVVSRIAGLDELVQDGVTGLLCEPGNAEELAAALLRLARDRQLACAMGQAGRRLARERFSIDATVAATVGLYDELLHRCDKT